MKKKFQKLNELDCVTILIIFVVVLIIFVAMSCLYTGNNLIESIIDVFISIGTGIFTGYIVSLYYEQKAQKENIRSDIEHIINSLRLLSQIIGSNTKETKKNIKDTITIINEWNIKLKNIKKYFQKNKYKKEDINVVESIMGRLSKIEEKSRTTKEDYRETVGREILGIWVELDKIMKILY